MNRYDEIYPLTIVMDRYNGTYSGAQFTAWNKYFDEVPPEIDGSDVPCMHFWSKADRSTIGFGSDPTAAYNNLLAKMQAVDVLHKPRRELQIDEVWPVSTDICKKGGIGIDWSGDIGFGQWTVWWGEDGKLHADTECLDNNDSKKFTKAILERLVDLIVVDD